MATSEDREFTKTEYEEYTIAIEYSGRLPTGATVTTLTVTATDRASKQTDSSVLSGATSTSGTQGRQKVTGGKSNKDYILAFKMVLSTGEKLEDQILMKVRNPFML